MKSVRVAHDSAQRSADRCIEQECNTPIRTLLLMGAMFANLSLVIQVHFEWDMTECLRDGTTSAVCTLVPSVFWKADATNPHHPKNGLK